MQPLLEGVVLLFRFDLISTHVLYSVVTTMLVVILWFIPITAFSATITVRSTNDEVNEDGDCSLREAILSANQNRSFDECEAGNGPDIIVFASRGEPRVFRLFRGRINEDAGTSGDLDITEDLTIIGDGPDATMIQLGVARDRVERIFDIAPNDQVISVAISNLTLTATDLPGQANHGYAIHNRSGGTLLLEHVTIRALQSDTGDEGVVFNEGNLTLDQCSIIDNRRGESGGIVNLGALDVVRSQIAGNTGRMGGGLLNRDHLTIDASTISDNRATSGEGDGIYNENMAIIRSSALVDNRANRGGAAFNTGVIVIENSTLSGNQGEAVGGIDNQRVLTVRHSTITKNDGNTGTGGIHSDGVVALSHAIVVGNTSNAPMEADCSGSGLTSLGYNLVGKGCPHAAIGDRLISGEIVSTTVLQPLQNNGGPTVTHALQPGSLAIDTGSVDCPPPTVDQRGLPRPSDGSGDGLPVCDIGAFEADPIPLAAQALWLSSRANIGSAGLDRALVLGCGESDPGDLPPFAPIPQDAVAVRLTATGDVMLNDIGNALDPDGEIIGETTYIGPDGIGLLTTERRGFLAGIFAPASPPSLPAPPPLTITGQEQVQDSITSPPLQLYNLFYISDGRSNAGQTLVVQLPQGATRLYLGVVDACDGEAPLGSYHYNSGAWMVDVEFVFDPMMSSRKLKTP